VSDYLEVASGGWLTHDLVVIARPSPLLFRIKMSLDALFDTTHGGLDTSVDVCAWKLCQCTGGVNNVCIDARDMGMVEVGRRYSSFAV
jgi:hypothetical protein